MKQLQLEKLRKLMADVLETTPDQIADDMSMENTEIWDSLKHMELIVGIEENFGIEIDATEMIEMTSVAAIKQAMIAKGITF